MPIFWWLRQGSYTKFIARELTSLAVGYAALLLIVTAWAVGRGEGTYARLQALLARPEVLVFHAVVALALLFHAVTWLNLAPKALVLRLGKRRVPDAAVLVGHYLAWAAASALVAWLLLGG
jgi:fumarate reductase subunit C